MYENLKRLAVSTMTKDDLEEALVAVASLAKGYDQTNIPQPEWLFEKHEQVRMQYDMAVSAAVKAEIRRLEAEDMADRTPGERRAARRATLDALYERDGSAKRAKAASITEAAQEPVAVTPATNGT